MKKEKIGKVIDKLTNTKLKKVILTIICLVIINLTITLITGINLFVRAYSYIVDMTNGYQEEVKNVEIKAEGYDEHSAGSYKITKSAEWIEKGKAQLNIKLDTNIEYDSKEQDLIIILDTSIPNNANGVCNTNTKETLKELGTDIIKDNGKVSLITMSRDSNILISNTNNTTELTNIIENISCEETSSITKEYNNYYKALENIEAILSNVNSDETVNALFITDGYANKDTPNENIEYKLLKKLYKNLNIIGIEHNLGTEVSDKFNKITDSAYITDNTNFKEIVMDKIMTSNYFNHFEIKEVIDPQYYNYDNSNSEINTSVGNASVEIEDNKQVITWTIGENELKTGSSANLKIDLEVTNNKSDKKGYYHMSDNTSATSSTKNSLTYEIKSNDSLVLKHGYDVTYQVQAPSGCNAKNPDKEFYYAFDKVNIIDTEPTCEGYTFAGWKVKENVQTVNSKQFVMPTSNVNIVGTWVKSGISKTMDGTIHPTATIYKAIAQQATKDNSIDLSQVSSDSNGKGVYELTKVNTSRPVYYYRGNVDNNNVLFARYCWKIIRTTEEGNVKLIFNGRPSNGQCSNTGENTIIGTSDYNSISNSPLYTGYIYDSNSDEIDDKKSDIKELIDNWYQNNLSKYEEFIADTKFYNERGYTISYEDNKQVYNYSSKNRLENNSIRLNASNNKDIINTKVGLITSDEVILAGSAYDSDSNNYLNNNTNYFTLSPYNYKQDYSANMIYVNASGALKSDSVASKYGIRPVISISGDLEYTGTGRLNDPYDFGIKFSTTTSEFNVGDYVEIISDNKEEFTPISNNKNIESVNPSEIKLYRIIKNSNNEILAVADKMSQNKITLDATDDIKTTLDSIYSHYSKKEVTSKARAINESEEQLIKNLYPNDTNYWVIRNSYDNYSYFIRPILVLVKDKVTSDGDGSITNPYKFE